MKTRMTVVTIGLILAMAFAIAIPQAALAAGTEACTPISNSATINYQVSGAAQAAVNSNTNTIVVGNKVSLTVVSLDAAPGPSVVPNQSGALLNFRITNNGNANEQYALSTKLFSGSTTSVFSGNVTVTDTFDAASVQTGVASVPTVTTVVVAPNGTVDVTIIGTMPAPPLNNGDYAVYALIAKAVNPTTGNLEANGNTNIVSPFGACSADIVLDFESGTLDAGVRGASSARDAFYVALNNLTISKSSIVYTDPINGSSSPKAIPGAVVEYTVVISNAGNALNATNVVISDTLPVTLTPVNGAWQSTNGGNVSCTNQAVANIGGGGWACVNPSSWTGQALSATINTLNSGATATVLYQAVIQ